MEGLVHHTCTADELILECLRPPCKWTDCSKSCRLCPCFKTEQAWDRESTANSIQNTGYQSWPAIPLLAGLWGRRWSLVMVKVALVGWPLSGDASLMLPLISAPLGLLCWASRSWPARTQRNVFWSSISHMNSHLKHFFLFPFPFPFTLYPSLVVWNLVWDKLQRLKMK